LQSGPVAVNSVNAFGV